MIPPVIRGEIGGPGLAPVVMVIAVVGAGHVRLPLSKPGQGVLVVHLLLGGHLDWAVLVHLSESVSSVSQISGGFKVHFSGKLCMNNCINTKMDSI